MLRPTDAFVPHAHMDQFVGFDRLLRTYLHLTTLRLVGAGFAVRVEHKLRAYTLNLYERSSSNSEIASVD